MKLLVEGQPVENATHWGAIDITTAVDEHGNSLASQEQAGRHKLIEFEELNREHMWFFEDVRPKDKIKVDIPLSVTPRSSKTLAVLEGSLQIRRMQTKPIVITDLAMFVGKTVDDNELSALGISVKLLEYTPKNPSQYIKFQVTDPKELVQDTALVDARGKTLSQSHSSFGFNHVRTIQLGGVKPMSSDPRLKLVVKTGQQDIEVPFSLKDLPLP